MQNNFEIKRMMSHLVLKLCITTLKVIYCYASVYCKYKSPLVVPKILRDGFSHFRSGGVDKYPGGAAAACFGRGVVATPGKAKEKV